MGSHDIFISYAGKDTAIAERIYRRLVRYSWQGRKLRVAFAPQDIGGGQSIPGRLLELLAGSVCTVAIVTPHWRDSRWCRFEQEAATWEDPASDARKLIPLMMSWTVLPGGLSRIKFVDFQKESEFERRLKELIGTIRSVLDRARETEVNQHRSDALLRTSLLPWIGPATPSLRLIWPDMIVDPEVISHRSGGRHGRLGIVREELAAGHRRFIILAGEPGSGKSTALRSMVLEDQQSGIGGARRFYHAREILPSENNDGAEDLELSLLAIDGLDEVTVDRAMEVLGLASELAKQKSMVWIGSRTDFIYRYALEFKAHWGHLDEVLEIMPWSPEDAQRFVENYLSKTGQSDPAGEILAALEDSRHRAVLLNPMRLTLLLYIATTSRHLSLPSMQEPFTLYERFYSEWLGAETARGTTKFSAAEVTAAHTLVAKWLYEHRGSGYPFDLLESSELTTDTAFSGLLEIDIHRESVTRFRHETVGEYLIAKSILDAFRRGGSAIDDALDLTVGHDVNEFTRSGLSGVPPADSNLIVDNLLLRYSDLLGGEQSTGVVRVREQILYYLGRTDNPRCFGSLEKAAREEVEPLLRRSAILGCILAGNYVVEAEYIQRLLSSSEEDLLNRSVQMCYFGDVSDDLHTFRDSDDREWTRTKVNIVQRLPLGSKRAHMLRWWDLATLVNFGRSRGEIVFSQEQWDSIVAARGNLSGPGERVAGMSELIDEVLRLSRVSEPGLAFDAEPWLRW